MKTIVVVALLFTVVLAGSHSSSHSHSGSRSGSRSGSGSGSRSTQSGDHSPISSDLPLFPAAGVVVISDKGFEPTTLVIAENMQCVRFYNYEENELRINSISGPSHPWTIQVPAGDANHKCFQYSGNVEYSIVYDIETTSEDNSSSEASSVSSKKSSSGSSSSGSKSKRRANGNIIIRCSEDDDCWEDGTCDTDAICVYP